jgi:hypothetical protein
MKNFLIALLMICSGTVAISQSNADPLIRFSKMEHAFGNIKKDKPVTIIFTFTNPGSKPIIIEDATAECGCTKPEFPQQPIMPGKKGTIKVTYDAKELGSFNKKVTVKLVKVAETRVLTITGKVIP